VYGWFTEGFDTLDLKEAKALLEELASWGRSGACGREPLVSADPRTGRLPRRAKRWTWSAWPDAGQW